MRLWTVVMLEIYLSLSVHGCGYGYASIHHGSTRLHEMPSVKSRCCFIVSFPRTQTPHPHLHHHGCVMVSWSASFNSECNFTFTLLCEYVCVCVYLHQSCVCKPSHLKVSEPCLFHLNNNSFWIFCWHLLGLQ